MVDHIFEIPILIQFLVLYILTLALMRNDVTRKKDDIQGNPQGMRL